MLKRQIQVLTLSAAVAAIGPVTAHAGGKDCVPIGGTGMPNFVPQADGTTTIVAPLTGSAVSTSGKITGRRETDTGLEMDMEHYFMTESGGFMQTRDLARLTKVAGTRERYMVEITYRVQEASTSGTLKGYKGQFSSYGLVDLEQLKGVIRYGGEICR